ncbi:MAG: peptidoglycan-associated lipoprotein Pal [Neomegalonema sp.]|nr:peptidoglycan-associated lipoprotein Pal [Neomegalonema sp.]
MRSLTLIALISAAALAGCSKTEPQISSTAGANGANGANASASFAPDSVQYFEVTVGDRVYFGTDSTDISPEARVTLDRQAQWLLANPQGSITIEGHADERGTREYNLALGARRANAVRLYLASRGVPSASMRTVTFGKERPVEVCSRDECWGKNRRAVTVIPGGAAS